MLQSDDLKFGVRLCLRSNKVRSVRRVKRKACCFASPGIARGTDCEFCHIYKGKKFSLRTVEEVKKDIDAIQAIVSEIQSLSRNMGFGGEINAAVVRAVLHSPRPYPEGYRSIILWLYRGGENVFLQDANNLTHRTKDLVEILTYLKKAFPTVQRITTYSRARTIARKTLEELRGSA